MTSLLFLYTQNARRKNFKQFQKYYIGLQKHSDYIHMLNSQLLKQNCVKNCTKSNMELKNNLITYL